MPAPTRPLKRSVRWLAALAVAAAIGAAAQPASAAGESPAVATFAGGCFWCVEEAFEKVPGVITAISGYTGGHVPNPTYQQVSHEDTGHAEAVRVTYDPARVSYEQLVDWFWRNIDPTQANGQFCDLGSSYRSVIFVHDEAQRKVAEATKQALQASGRFKQPIATQIATAGPFYAAEDYHQGYSKKNPYRYRFYKFNCGRAQRLEQIWGKPTPLPNVTQ
ncbi:MAG: peptide-methionine (S)-S-oxide reductase MsrA [Hyphomicrobiaceae bacterium]|nr:peptide-methionine (S)-S-oxide reductase MsrA [Hyphomicrobiaceae bacterium]